MTNMDRSAKRKDGLSVPGCWNRRAGCVLVPVPCELVKRGRVPEVGVECTVGESRELGEGVADSLLVNRGGRGARGRASTKMCAVRAERERVSRRDRARTKMM